MTLEKTLYDVGRELKDLPREVYDYMKENATQTYKNLRRQYDIALATPGSRAILRNPEEFAVIPYITEELIEKRHPDVEASIVVGELEKYALDEENSIGKRFYKRNNFRLSGNLLVLTPLCTPFIIGGISFFSTKRAEYLGIGSFTSLFLTLSISCHLTKKSDSYYNLLNFRAKNEEKNDFFSVSFLDPTKIIIDREEQK